MFNSRWVLLAAFVSFSSFGGTSLQQKQLKVEALMKMKLQAPMLAVEGFLRELEYEDRGLSLQVRSKIEANILADKMRQQIVTAYKSALNEHKSPDLAREEVRTAIEADLEMAHPEMKDELLKLSLETLDNIDNGGISEEVELSSVQETMEGVIVSRRTLLNINPDPSNVGADQIQPKANSNKDSERKDYASRAELIESLVSDRESSRWVSTANQTVKTAQVLKTESKLSLQVKMEFLGATVEAGPTIAFSREISTDAVIMSEGYAPVITSGGNFDRVKRERDNSVAMKNGKVVPRYIAFFCDVDLKFASDSTVSGGLKYMGMGADVSVSSSFQSAVNIQSRRIALPESVGGKMVTVKYLSELCHNDFLKGRYSNNMTVAQSLTVLMKNVVAGLVYSNAKTKCATDADCSNWYRSEVITLKKKNNVARCVEHVKEKYRFCQLRGKVGQKCSVIEKNKRTSSGENEYPCDWGLRCVKKESAAYLGSWKVTSSEGTCQK